MNKETEFANSGAADGTTHLRAQPSQKRAAKNVEKILRAAAELISDGGVANLTTSLVAEQAGIPIGSLYRYFKNKESIISELAARYQAEKDRENATWLPDIDENLPIRDYIALWVDQSQDSLRANEVYRELLNFAVRLPDRFDLLMRLVERKSEHARDLNVFKQLNMPDEDRDAFLSIWLGAETSLEEMLLNAESDEEYEVLKEQMKAMLTAFIEASNRAGSAS